MKAISYARVSTAEQAETGLGLAAQQATITTAIAARGWTLVDALVDEGRSGSTLNRPALTEAIDRLDRGDADVLVVAKLDRLSRSVLDFAHVCARAKRKGWAIVCLDVDVDTTSPTGELVANIASSVSQWERRIIGARTADALQALKANGVRLGRPVELPVDVRQRIAAEHHAGATLSGIARRLNDEQVPTVKPGARWHASTIKAVLRSLDLDAQAVPA